MNKLCQCDGSTCTRHQMTKTKRERELCSGEADTSDNGLSYWKAWEQGKAGATAPAEPVLTPAGFGRSSSAAKAAEREASSIGTKLKAIIKRVTGREIVCATCVQEIDTLNRMTPADAATARTRIVSGIRSRAWGQADWKNKAQLTADRIVSAATFGKVSPARWIIGRWFDEAVRTGAEPDEKKKRKPLARLGAGVEFIGEPMPFTDTPHLTLVFHCWPKVGGWERHIEPLKKIEHRFDRKLMGVSLGADGCDTMEKVRETFGDSWEYLDVKNDPYRGECDTLQWALDEASDDVNAVTFYCHSKGTKNATMNSDAVHWWTEAMYETVIHNVDSVLDTLAGGAMFAGSLRYVGDFFPSHGNWHYPGSYWAMRNCKVISPQCKVQETYYGTEAFPSDYSEASESACMFTEIPFPHLYDVHQQPRRELVAWRASQNK